MTKRQRIIQSLVIIYRELRNIFDELVPKKVQKKLLTFIDYLPLIISVSIVLTVIGLYFFQPDFQEISKEGWHVLTSGDRKKISAWVSEFGLLGPVFIIGFMILQMFAIVVNVVALMVVAVLAYGWFWGSIISFTGIFLASTLGYFIGKLFGKGAVQKIIGKKSTDKIHDQVQRYGVWAVIVARISPFISNDAISFIAGLADMKYITFMSATVVGILPLIFLIAYLGEDIDRLKSGLIWISVISIGALVLYFFYNRFFRKSKPENEPQ